MNAFWLSGVVYGTFPFALLREREMQEDKLAAQPAGDSTTILTACLPAWLTSRSLFGASHFLKWCANVERKVILLLLCLLLTLASFFNLFLILLLQFYYYYFYLFACYFVGKYQLQSQSRRVAVAAVAVGDVDDNVAFPCCNFATRAPLLPTYTSKYTSLTLCMGVCVCVLFFYVSVPFWGHAK